MPPHNYLFRTRTPRVDGFRGTSCGVFLGATFAANHQKKAASSTPRSPISHQQNFWYLQYPILVKVDVVSKVTKFMLPHQ